MNRLLMLVACSLLVACATARAPLAPCTLPNVNRAVVCGSVAVPENRGVAGGRSINLNVAVIRASSGEATAEPLVMLAGGPGQGATEIAPIVVPDLEPLLETRDLVLIDQRGTGRSNPLTCAAGFGLFEPNRDAEVQRCLAELSARADVTQYTTDAAVDDLRDALAVLRYGRVNIIAGSYGTRAAFVFMRRYPELVRTAVLRAVAPPGFNIMTGGTRNAARQIEATIAACAADAACSRAYPNLREEFAAFEARVAKEPVRVGDIVVTPLLLNQTLYVLLLNSATRQTLPFLLHSAANGNFERLVPVMKQVQTAVYGALPVGMYLSVVCSEDAPNVSAAEAEEMQHAFGGAGAAILRVCNGWPRGRIAPELAERTPIDIPTLLVSGVADPATPEESGVEAMRILPRGTHVIASATAHIPQYPGCLRDLVTRFVESGGTATLDVTCARELQWPPFIVPKQ